MLQRDDTHAFKRSHPDRFLVVVPSHQKSAAAGEESKPAGKPTWTIVATVARMAHRSKGTQMARVPYLSKSDLAEADQDLLNRPISLFKALVNSPKAARAFSGLGGYIRYGSKLDPRLRELAILQVGWLARSPYEWSHHVKLGHDFGVSDADIQALIDDTAGKPTTLDALSLTVLKAAREITDDGAMAAPTFTSLQTTLGNELVVDLTVTIAFYCAVVRLLATLEIDVEPDYMPYLERWPLPA
jgi:alkylhydroperoxidase family enzyme